MKLGEVSLGEAGALAWVLLVVGWYAIRYPFERRVRRTRVAESRRGSPEFARMAVSLVGLGILPGLFVATGWPEAATYRPHPLFFALGLGFGSLALLLFRLTHKALGRMWSVSLDLKEGHRLVTEGIYGRVRHPMYAAFWAMALAQALLLPNGVAGPAGLLGFGTLFALRLRPEERMMEEAFGDEYRDYSRRTARLIPGLF